MLLRLGDLFSLTLASAKRQAKHIAITAALFTVLVMIIWFFVFQFAFIRAADVVKDMGLDRTNAEIRTMLVDAVSEKDRTHETQLQKELQALAVREGGKEVDILLTRIQSGDLEASSIAKRALDDYAEELEEQAEKNGDAVPGSTMTTTVYSGKNAEELIGNVQSGDAAAADTLRHELLLSDYPEDRLTDELVNRVVFEVPIFVTIVLFVIILMVFLGHLVQGAYLLLALSSTPLAQSALWRRAAHLALPLIGVTAWTFIRSFVWVPFLLLIPGMFAPTVLLLLVPGLLVSVLLAAFYFPRFALSRVYLVHEKLGVRAAVQKSFERSRGYWGKIVTNTLAWGLVLMAVGLSLQLVISGGLSLLISGMSGSIHSQILLAVPQTFIGQIGLALSIIFIAHMALNIAENPRVVTYPDVSTEPNALRSTIAPVVAPKPTAPTPVQTVPASNVKHASKPATHSKPKKKPTKHKKSPASAEE